MVYSTLQVLPLLTHPKEDISDEALSLLKTLLFSGNETVQKGLEFVKYTREERLFIFLQTKLRHSSPAISWNVSIIAIHYSICVLISHTQFEIIGPKMITYTICTFNLLQSEHLYINFDYYCTKIEHSCTQFVTDVYFLVSSLTIWIF